MMSSETVHHESILKHHQDCKIDNKSRLKEVKNLEELINFRIKTVGDALVEDGGLVNNESHK